MTTDDIYEMDNPAQLRVVIKHFTGISDVGDNDVKVKIVPGQKLIMFKDKGNVPNADYPSIIELLNPDNGKSLGLSSGELASALFTRFDGKLLSERTLEFQLQVAEMFVNTMIFQNEDLNTDDSNVRDDLRQTVVAILDDKAPLERYLDNPELFLSEVEQTLGVTLSPEERVKFTEATSKRNAIYSLFEYGQLGESAGDGDSYILIGTNGQTNTPSIETMTWLQQFLAEFVERFGFLPAYGSYVTEAVLRKRVIMGPDVTEREKGYIEDHVYDHHDYRNGRQIKFADFE